MIRVNLFKEGIEQNLWEVYYTAIRLGCANHYTPVQLQAWAPDDFDGQIFSEKMKSLKPYVAYLADKIVGYGDLQSDGYIDHFYVHGKHQGLGVGYILMERIIKEGKNLPRLYSNVSNRARPFFERYGFSVTKKQLIEIRGEQLENNAMELIQVPRSSQPRASLKGKL